jgi:hypothetical protein
MLLLLDTILPCPSENDSYKHNPNASSGAKNGNTESQKQLDKHIAGYRTLSGLGTAQFCQCPLLQACLATAC